MMEPAKRLLTEDDPEDLIDNDAVVNGEKCKAHKKRKKTIANKNEEGFRVYIGNLNPEKDIKEIKLSVRSFFSMEGIDIQGVRCDLTRQFGYVNFASDQELRKALDLNGKTLMGRPVQLYRASSQSNSQEIKELNAQTLIIKNLPVSITQNELKEIFDQAINIKISDDHDDFNGGVAYVEFATEAIAEMVFEEAEGSDVQGHSIIIDYAVEKRTRVLADNPSNRLFVNNLSLSAIRYGLQHVFEKAVSITIENVKKQRFAFLEFESVEDAMEALKTYNNKEIHGRSVRLAYLHKNRSIEEEANNTEAPETPANSKKDIKDKETCKFENGKTDVEEGPLTPAKQKKDTRDRETRKSETIQTVEEEPPVTSAKRKKDSKDKETRQPEKSQTEEEASVTPGKRKKDSNDKEKRQPEKSQTEEEAPVTPAKREKDQKYKETCQSEKTPTDEEEGSVTPAKRKKDTKVKETCLSKIAETNGEEASVTPGKRKKDSKDKEKRQPEKSQTEEEAPVTPAKRKKDKKYKEICQSEKTPTDEEEASVTPGKRKKDSKDKEKRQPEKSQTEEEAPVTPAKRKKDQKYKETCQSEKTPTDEEEVPVNFPKRIKDTKDKETPRSKKERTDGEEAPVSPAKRTNIKKYKQTPQSETAQSDGNEALEAPAKQKLDTRDKKASQYEKADTDGEGFRLSIGSLNQNKDFDQIKLAITIFFLNEGLKIEEVCLAASKKFGYVDFASEEDLQKALELNGRNIMGQPVKLDRYRRKEALDFSGFGLFIGNLNQNKDTDQIKSAITLFFLNEGLEIQDLGLAASKNFGYVNFASEKELQKALELNGRKILGQPVKLDKCGSKENFDISGFGLFIGNLNQNKVPDQIKSAVTIFFSNEGLEIQDLCLVASKNFGFVYFSSEEELQKALELNGRNIMGQQVKLERCRHKENVVENKEFRLYIGNLNQNKDSDEIKSAIEMFFSNEDIEIQDVHLVPFRNFGHVDFASEEDLQKAWELSGRNIMGQPVKLDRYRTQEELAASSSNKILRVRNLPTSVTEDSLRCVFEKSVAVRLPIKAGKVQRFAFVQFESMEDATEALENFNNTEIDGQIVNIEVSKGKKERGEERWGNTASIHPSNVLLVNNLSFNATKDTLWSLFSKAVDIKIPFNMNGQTKRFGFVQFASVEDAKEALETCNRTEIDGRCIRLEFCHGKEFKETKSGFFGLGKRSVGYGGYGGRGFQGENSIESGGGRGGFWN